MENKEGGQNRRILWRFLVSYIVILIIPLLFGSLVYMVVVDIVKDDAEKYNTSILEQTRDVLDRRLAEVDSMVDQIILNKKIKSLLYLEHIDQGSSDYYKVWDVWNHLPDYRMTNKFIVNYYIFFKKAGIVISPDTTYVEIPKLLEKCMMIKEKDAPISFISIDYKEGLGIAYLRSFGNDNGMIMILIDRNEVDKLLRKANIGDEGIVAVFEKNGELITYISGPNCSLNAEDIERMNSSNVLDFIANNENMIASVVSSSENGWRYVSIVPREFIMSKVDYIKEIILGVVLSTLLSGLLAAFFLAYRNTKPIRDLVIEIRGTIGNSEYKEKNEYEFVQKVVFQLIKNNKHLQGEMDNQRVLLKSTFFGRLLNGEFHNNKELEIYLKYIGIQLTGVRYAALIFKVDLYEDLVSQDILKELDIIRLVLKDLLTNQFKHRIYFYDVDSYRVGALISFEDGDEIECVCLTEQIVTKVQQRLYEDYNSNVVCSGGEICTDILDIGNSFEQAKKFFDYKLHGKERGVVWYSQIPNNHELYYYPIDVEMRLMNHMRVGDTAEVDKEIKNIYKENFLKRQLSLRMTRQLIYSIKGTIFRQSSQSDYVDYMEDIYEEMYIAETPENFFNVVTKACLKICELNTCRKKDVKRQFKEKVLKNLKEIYTKEDVNLYMFANKFGVTESYMYQYFKEYIGVTFSSYLENMRIQRACELLLQSDIPVKEIAGMVGYNNDHTFRRAFKRVIGVNPGDYRNALIANIMA